jgi:DNA-damage-inducible protein J
MKSTEVVRARITPDLKRRAVACLDESGMSVSIAIQLLMTRLAEDPEFVHTLKVPNAETIAAFNEPESSRTRYKTVAEMMEALNAGD